MTERSHSNSTNLFGSSRLSPYLSANAKLGAVPDHCKIIPLEAYVLELPDVLEETNTRLLKLLISSKTVFSICRQPGYWQFVTSRGVFLIDLCLPCATRLFRIFLILGSTEPVSENMKFIGFLLLFNLLIAVAYKDEQCEQRTDEQLIWEYNVRRSYRIGVHQEVEAEYGPTNVTITCIGVDSLSGEDNAVMWVTSGGIGYNFIKIKFRSQYSRGFHYRVYVYGRPYRINKFNLL